MELVRRIKGYFVIRLKRARFYFWAVSLGKKGYLTREEKDLIVSKSAELGMNYRELSATRLKLYRNAFNRLTSADAVSSESESKLNDIEEFFGIPSFELKVEKHELWYLRQLSEAESGNLPTIDNAGIALQKGELVHWFEPASILEVKVVGRRYEGGSSGVSFRIAKGVSYRVGNHRGRLVTDKALVTVADGRIYLTNKRVVFSGDAKSFEVKVEKILNCNFADDGLMFNTGGREKPYVVRLNNAKRIRMLEAVYNGVISKSSF